MTMTNPHEPLNCHPSSESFAIMVTEFVYFKKMSRMSYVVRILRNIFSVTFLWRTGFLFAYYIINYVHGYRLAHVGRNCKVHPTVLLRHSERIFIGDGCLLNHNNVLQAGKKNATIRIGHKVMTGPNVMMFAYDHGTEQNGVPMIDQPYIDSDIIIENDVWIGAGSIILSGSHIQNGVVVGAGSVVKGQLPPKSICAGIPAKVIHLRRDDST